MTWTPRTLHDERPPDVVKAPCCNRMVPADLLVRVPADLAPDLAKHLPWTHACDSCRENLHRRGLVTRSALYAALGAPPEHVAAIAAQHGEPMP